MNQYVIDFLTEFLGTFIFLYVIFSTGNYLAIGAILAILILLVHNYSIASFNPAASIAMYYNNKISKQTLLIVLIAEILGGLLTIPFLNKIK